MNIDQKIALNKRGMLVCAFVAVAGALGVTFAPTNTIMFLSLAPVILGCAGAAALTTKRDALKAIRRNNDSPFSPSL